jgi:hypothetical protein
MMAADCAKVSGANQCGGPTVRSAPAGLHFRQPKEGLGYDGSPVAHRWQTIATPDHPLQVAGSSRSATARATRAAPP